MPVPDRLIFPIVCHGLVCVVRGLHIPLHVPYISYRPCRPKPCLDEGVVLGVWSGKGGSGCSRGASKE
jgi:hypothetical protein